MLIVHVFVHVKPDCIAAFEAASLDNARHSLQEPGIARFDVIQQADDPTRFVLVEAYRDEHMRLYRTSGSKPFFQQQRAALQTQLADAERDLRAAKNRMGVGSIETRRETLETRLSSIELARNTALQQIAATEARSASLTARLDALPERLHSETRVMPNTGADELRSTYQETKANLSSEAQTAWDDFLNGLDQMRSDVEAKL